MQALSCPRGREGRQGVEVGVLGESCRASFTERSLGNEQGPAGITQLLCELTFPTPWLFSPIPVCPSTQHLLFGKSGLFPWKMYTLKFLEVVL